MSLRPPIRCVAFDACILSDFSVEQAGADTGSNLIHNVGRGLHWFEGRTRLPHGRNAQVVIKSSPYLPLLSLLLMPDIEFLQLLDVLVQAL